MLFDNNMGKGRRVVTFANILRDNVFPLAQSVDFMLSLGQQAMGRPVEIEFAGVLRDNLTTSVEKGQIYWLQIRPIIDRKEIVDNTMLEAPRDEIILRSNTALGHGLIGGIRTIVYVRPQKFDRLVTRRIAEEITKINNELAARKEKYILVGPGRWGTSDPSLGIPVKWADIANSRLIVESSLHNYNIEPSQGSHFFQNLTSFGVGYLTVTPEVDGGIYNVDFLDSQSAFIETEFVRVVRFENPLQIGIDGLKNIGVVLKPKNETA